MPLDDRSISLVVLIGVALLLAFAAVPLLGGSLDRLLDLRLRLIGLVAGAFVVQILIVNVAPGALSHDANEVVHMATYVVIGIAVVANLRVPGVPVIALGGLSNALAIAANGGVMPASASALATAGMTADPEAFTNSALVENANLAFLGDVFAVPAWVPAANVFSVGDLLLILGGWILVMRVTGARAPWRARRGPALVLFDASGAIEAVTPPASELLSRLDGLPPGVALPPEAFVVAGRARAHGGCPELHVLDRHGRPLHFSATPLPGRAVALALSA